MFCALVKLGLGDWEALSTWFILVLSSSASCWLSFVQAASMAVLYSKLGGCFGETTKFGPLGKTYLCALVKGLLDKLMTHFGLGSSLGEEPWELLCLLGKVEGLASWELALLVAWGTLAWEEPDWEALLSSWELALSAKGYCLPGNSLPESCCFGKHAEPLVWLST